MNIDNLDNGDVKEEIGKRLGWVDENFFTLLVYNLLFDIGLRYHGDQQNYMKCYCSFETNMKVFRYFINTYIDDSTREYIKEPCRNFSFDTPSTLLNHVIQKAKNGCDAHRVIEVFLRKLYGSIDG